MTEQQSPPLERAIRRVAYEQGTDLDFARELVEHSVLGRFILLAEHWKDFLREFEATLPGRLFMAHPLVAMLRWIWRWSNRSPR